MSTKKGQVNLFRALGVITAVCVLGALFFFLGRINDETRRVQVTGYANCLRQNDGRMRAQEINADDVTIVFTATLPDSAARTPAQQQFLDDLRARLVARGKEVLPPTDCEKASPPPPGMTDAEKKLLPKSEPIPPLRLP